VVHICLDLIGVFSVGFIVNVGIVHVFIYNTTINKQTKPKNVICFKKLNIILHNIFWLKYNLRIHTACKL